MQKNKIIYFIILISLSIYSNGQNNFSYKFTDNKLQISKSFEIFDTTKVSVNNNEYYIIDMGEEVSCSQQAGLPSLPQYVLLVNLPTDKQISIEEKIIETERIQLNKDIKVIPKQASHTKNTAEFPFIINEKHYQTNSFYPESLVSIKNEGMFLGQNLSAIVISPIKYNPRQNIIELIRKIEIEISFSDSEEGQKDFINNKASKVSQEFFAHNIIQNKSSFDTSLDNIPYTLVILSPENYSQTLKPFISWKKKQGFNVIPLYIDETFSNPNEIKNNLKYIYEDNERHFDYLLICGDVEQIPSFIVNSEFADDGIHYTDLYYADYTSDALADVLYGRISARDTSELRNILDKTINYESYNFPDDNFLDKSLLVAGHTSQASEKTMTNGQLNYAKQYLALFSDTSVYYNSQSSEQINNIKTDINNGNAWINYTAHCNEIGWLNPSIDTCFTNSMNNTEKYGLFINNCCLAGRYDYEECFSENLIRQNNKGAVASIGASDYTMWEEDYYWSVGFKNISLNPTYNANKLGVYDKFFHTHNEALTQHAITLGQMLSAGVLSVLQSNSPYYSYYSEIYNLQGDPTLVAYTGKGRTILSDYPDSVCVGTQVLSFNTEPYAYICLSRQDSIVAIAKANDVGAANIDISQISEPCTLDIVISAQFCCPTIDSISFVAPENGYISVSDIQFINSSGEQVARLEDNTPYTINLKLKNIGKETFFFNQSSLQLFSNDSNIIMQDSVHNLYSLNPNEETNILSAFSLKTIPAIKDKKKINLSILINKNDNTQREHRLSILSQAPDLNIDDFYLHFTNSDTVELGFSLFNNGSLASNNGFVEISLLDTSLAIQPILPKDWLPIKFYLNPLLYTDSIVFNVIYKAGSYIVSKIFCIAMNGNIENFENDIFSSLSWENNEQKPWVIDSSFSHSGKYSFRSFPTLKERECSSFSILVNTFIEDSISFYTKLSSETDHDIFSFLIDGVNILELSGFEDWCYQSFPLAQGSHKLEFSYAKDEWVNIGYDAAWIDDITLPRKGYIAVGLEENQENAPKIFPNPSSSYINIEGVSQNTTIHIYDINGKLRYFCTVNNGHSKQIHTAFLENGFYTVSLTNNNKAYFTEKLIINKM